jgi:hypothetical protein
MHHGGTFLPVPANLWPKVAEPSKVSHGHCRTGEIDWMPRIYDVVAHSNFTWFHVDNPYRDLQPICDRTGWTGGVEVLPPRPVRPSSIR